MLNEMGHAPRRPQAGLIAESLWPALQTALNTPQIFRTETRLSSGSPGFLECPQSALLKLSRPPTYRLPVYPNAAGDFGLGDSSAQQFRSFAAALL
jgi:hypothetical protein